MVSDYRHVPSSPGMWKEPDAGPDRLVSTFLVFHRPSPQQQPVMSARSATRPGLKVAVNEFQIGWITLKRINLLGTHPYVEKHKSDVPPPLPRCVYAQIWKAFTTTILPRSDCDIPSLHFNPFHLLFFSFFLMEQFVLLPNPVTCSTLLSALTWLCCKVFLICGAQGTWFNFVLSLYSLIKG